MPGYDNFKKTFLISIGGSSGFSALLAIFVFLRGDFGELELSILSTTLIIALFSITSLACTALWEKGEFAVFAIIGFMTSIGGFTTPKLLIGVLMQNFCGVTLPSSL